MEMEFLSYFPLSLSISLVVLLHFVCVKEFINFLDTSFVIALRVIFIFCQVTLFLKIIAALPLPLNKIFI